MSWSEATGWDMEDLGVVAGVRVRRLRDYPGRSPKKREAADVAILDALMDSGVRGMFSENHLWTTLWVLLYWDAIFGSETPVRGNDIPQDLFTDGFVGRRSASYKSRRARLGDANLRSELKAGRKKSRAGWTRLLEDSDTLPADAVDSVIEATSANTVLTILDRLWQDYNSNRSGLPDLLVVSSEVALVEVKGPKDRIAENQCRWLRYLAKECNVATEVLVVGWSDRKVANLRKALGEVPSRKGSSAVHSSAVRATKRPSPSGVVLARKSPPDAPDGEYWKDLVAALPHSPSARFCAAIEGIGYPGDYKEAAVAIRAMIRERRKRSESPHEELRILYGLAAESGFLFDTPYIEGIGPGFNVSASITQGTLTSLVCSYDLLGFSELTLCNKTDRKWFVEAWGEPRNHQTPQGLNGAVWEDAVRATHVKVKARERESAREWEQMIEASSKLHARSSEADALRLDRTAPERPLWRRAVRICCLSAIATAFVIAAVLIAATVIAVIKAPA